MSDDLSKAQLEKVERMTGEGVWEADLDRGSVLWSRKVFDIHELPDGDEPPRDVALRFFPEPGRSTLRDAEARLSETGEPYDLTLPFVTAKGRQRLVRITGAVNSVEGRPSRAHGRLSDVTSEVAERHHLHRLAALAANTTNAVIVTDADGLTEWVNPPCEALTGYTLQELTGKKPGSVLQCPGTDPKTVALVHDKLAAREPVDVEILNRSKSGRDYWIRMEIMPLYEAGNVLSGFIAIQSDITERKENEAVLARAARLGRMIELSVNEVFVFDAETLRFVDVNRGARCNLGYERSELLAMTPVDIKPRMTQGDFEALIAPLKRGDEDSLIFRTVHQRRDGTTYPAEIRLQLMAEDRPVFVAFVQDTTERDAAQAELIEAREKAEEASRAKSGFLATMSHEIRTPLNGVLGMAAVLNETLTEPAQRDMVDVIRQSGEHLLGILNDILDLSRVEAGQMSFEAVQFLPGEIARRIESVHTLKASEKGLAFAVHVAGAASAPRIGDPHRIAQVLHNLLSNAIKFTEVGEVCVKVDGAHGAPLRIVVTDTGIGMTPEQVDRVFDPFTQADSSTTRRFGGTGLGMSIVRGLVDAMDGEVSVESRPGVGTRVEVSLPLPMAEPSEPSAHDPARQHGKAPLSLKVLAADDNAVNRIVLAAMLDRLGVETLMGEDGTDAVKAWRPGLFDALLLDISMPGMDGRDALAEIRNREAAAGCEPTPALAITAHAMKHQVEEFMAAGFDGHLAKPLQLDALEHALRGIALQHGRQAV